MKCHKDKESTSQTKFNFFAFLLCGSYYIYKRNFIIGIPIYILTIIIPLNYYFFIGLCCGFFTNMVKYKTNVLGIILSVISILLFVILKLMRLYFIGGM